MKISTVAFMLLFNVLHDTLISTRAPAMWKDHQYQCLAGGYGLEIEVASMVVTSWIVAFCAEVFFNV